MPPCTGCILSCAPEKIWDVAEDNHGVITSAQARRLGVGPKSMVSMAANGRLERLGYGVYRLEKHVPGPYDEYAAAVALAGEGAFARGASFLMMRGLIPFDPAKMYLGVTGRIRRHLPEGYDVRVVQHPKVELIEGIRVECIPEATADARRCGAADSERLFAYRKGQAWPPLVVKGADWDAVYHNKKQNLDVLASADAAVDWANGLVNKIATA